MRGEDSPKASSLPKFSYSLCSEYCGSPEYSQVEGIGLRPDHPQQAPRSYFIEYGKLPLRMPAFSQNLSFSVKYLVLRLAEA
jgi:hypothetical protein